MPRCAPSNPSPPRIGTLAKRPGWVRMSVQSWLPVADGDIALVRDLFSPVDGLCQGRDANLLANDKYVICSVCAAVRPAPVDQLPSIRAMVPPGFRSPTHLANAASGSSTAHNTCRLSTTSYLPAASGVESQHQQTTKTASGTLARARSIISCEKSRPSTEVALICEEPGKCACSTSDVGHARWGRGQDRHQQVAPCRTYRSSGQAMIRLVEVAASWSHAPRVTDEVYDPHILDNAHSMPLLVRTGGESRGVVGFEDRRGGVK